MGTHHPIRKTVAREPSTPEIPDKLYFRIGDVARLCEVPAYVLRFWETEFPQLKPNKGGTGQRLYRKRDVEMALRIKSLLYDQGYTIPGARQVFKGDTKPAELKAGEPKPSELRSNEAREMAARETVQMMPANDVGSHTLDGLRRDARLHELRAEMAALLSTLSQATGSPAPGFSTKVQTMRPRLAVEPIRSRQLSLEGELF
jgi:DNA-binding transcriptional MerR regulator